jgi:ABC-type phosphate transport system substrate-binding protein
VRRLLPLLVLALVVSLTGVGRGYPVPGAFCNGPQEISGLGTPIQLGIHYEVIIPAFEARCTAGTGLVNYFAGTEEAVTQALTNRNRGQLRDLFFGREVPFNAVDKKLAEAGGGETSPIGHFPIYGEGIAVGYNLTCLTQPLKLRGAILQLIYAGVIDRWNHPLLLQDNPGLAACGNRLIRLSARVEPSGRSAVFKDYLSRFNPAWEPFELSQLNTVWLGSIACRGKGDDGMAGCVASNTGAIGYVANQVATAKGLKIAQMELVTTGQPLFVPPSSAACTAAAESTVTPQTAYDDSWSVTTLVGATQGYPICMLAYLVIGQYLWAMDASDGQGIALRDYLTVASDTAVQNALAARGLSKLPQRIRDVNKRGATEIQFGCPNPQPPC